MQMSAIQPNKEYAYRYSSFNIYCGDHWTTDDIPKKVFVVSTNVERSRSHGNKKHLKGVLVIIDGKYKICPPQDLLAYDNFLSRKEFDSVYK